MSLQSNHFEACVIRKLINGDDVDGHINQLSEPWKELAEMLQAEPSLSRRAQIVQTRANVIDDATSIVEMIFTADPEADLEGFQEPVDLGEIPLTDAGNAELIRALYGENVRYDHLRNRWLIWGGHRWRPDEDGEIERLALAAARERYKIAADINNNERRKKAIRWALGSENSGRIQAAIRMARVLKPIADTGHRWDDDPWLLGCSNGILDLRTGALRPGRPGDFVTMTTGIEFDPEARGERWELFLEEIFAGNKQLIEYIQKAIGYVLTGSTKEHCMFILWGIGANGKSTFLNAIRTILGDYAAVTPFSTFELAKGTQTNDLAALRGARFVVASEANEARRFNEARIKDLTGADPVTARFLFGEYFTYQPTYKLMLATNHKPTIVGTDEGIWRRIRLIPFTVSFKGREDRDLDKKLSEELPGILAWAVRGALLWQQEGLGLPEVVQTATNEFRVESDILGRFLEEATIQEPDVRVRGAELYGEYERWCAANGEKPLSGTAFGRRMKEREGIRTEKSGAIWYLGMGLTQKTGHYG